MKQEDKQQLLLKDLSARLPYHPMVYIHDLDVMDYVNYLYADYLDKMMLKLITLKPYLRPMDSMTEEEMEELKTLCSIYIPTDSPTIGFEEYGILVFTHHLTNNTYSFKLNVDVIDWFIANHFDYRGLIDMGLAIAVTKENNPYKEIKL